MYVKMWNRKELKKNALHVIKRNLWTILFVVFFMSIVFKEYSITSSSNGSIDTINRILVDIENGEDVKILEESETGGKQLTEYADEVINLALFGSKEGTITNINDKFDITHGIFYSFFNLVTSTRTQLKKVINSLTSIEAKLKFTRIIIIITSLAGLLVKILLVNPIIIGENL